MDLPIGPQSPFAHAFLDFKNQHLQLYGDRFHLPLLPKILVNNPPKSRNAPQGLHGVEISRIISGHATNKVYEHSFEAYYGFPVPSKFKTVLTMDSLKNGETYVEARRGVVVEFPLGSSSESE